MPFPFKQESMIKWIKTLPPWMARRGCQQNFLKLKFNKISLASFVLFHTKSKTFLKVVIDEGQLS